MMSPSLLHVRGVMETRMLRKEFASKADMKRIPVDMLPLKIRNLEYMLEGKATLLQFMNY